MEAAAIAPEARQVNLERESGNLKERYQSVRRYTEEICKPLETEDHVVQPHDDISPPKWHLAHTTWFFEELILKPGFTEYQPFHPRYSFLFNSYYDSIGERTLRMDRGNLSRPTVSDIMQYRKYVDEKILECLDHLSPQILAILEIGLNHEQQHQELLFTDIKYILGHNPMFPPYKVGFSESSSRDCDHEFLSIPQGEYSIGYNGYGFCYDNERESHRIMLRPFQIRKSLITNGEFLEFMRSGGYTRWDHWHSDGWAWVKENDIRSPLYWHFMDGYWFRYSLSGMEKVEEHEPVTHVSYYEAAAFASWKGVRLPTEFEWEAAADSFSWGQRWEHTNSAYLAYPGYVKPDGTVGEYNGKFMVNTMVLRGASIVTPPNHSRKTYRNFFYPHVRWQFNGIRVCKD
ncbi:MAG TPA: ergothioneine biosynthesis protein EgtB [Chryseosolibacter sp.]|nr:ergothioneine biosynthesis protein EgtB [Chryseosolibacter sp.]